MSKLASRWATEETLVKEALEQDSHAKHTLVAHGPAGPAAGPKNAPLVSKWANAPQSPTTNKAGHRLPSPPLTGDGERHEGRARRRGDKEGHANAKDSEGSTEHKERNQQGRAKELMSEFAKVFADRLDMDGGERSEKSHRNRKPRHEQKEHVGEKQKEDRHGGEKQKGQERGHDRNNGRANRSGNYGNGHHDKVEPDGDILHEKGPMTDAARSLALRIGMPAKETPTKQEKYISPRQKKELAARIDREKKEHKRLEEDRQKQAKLQKEVQEMFDKMSDKSTNWADIEDE